MDVVGCTYYRSCCSHDYCDQHEELKVIHNSLALNDFIKEKSNADRNLHRENDESHAVPGYETKLEVLIL
jgi:hypothetical protein